MAKRKLAKKRLYYYCSSSIANFHKKISQNFPLYEKKFALNSDIVYFGLYHPLDYLRFILNRGRKKVFWCGGDILNLSDTKIFKKIISKISAQHFCENDREYAVLKKMGIFAEITPFFFGNIHSYSISYKPSKNPNLYISAHPRREHEYGVEIIEKIAKSVPFAVFHIFGIKRKSKNKNVIYYGNLLEKDFDRKIKNFQSGLRLNRFDGFGEILAKSILFGQYPMSYIAYPHIIHIPDEKTLISEIYLLREKKKPNLQGRNYWKKVFEKSREKLLS